MKKLFIPLLITMTGLASNSAFAQEATVTKPENNSGFVTVVKDGITSTGTALDQTTAEKYLAEICGATGSGTSWIISETAPTHGTDESGVYFVEVNDYWIGMQGTWSLYDQVTKGVSKISAVKQQSAQETSSGTFYTHPATDVNKFFFIKQLSEKRRNIGGSNQGAFDWYDEWSYVSNTELNGADGWDALQPNWETLMDGAPFPAPHNCGSSLENNHYIALDGKLPTDRVGHDFTAYLYIPNNITNGTNYYFYSTEPDIYKNYGGLGLYYYSVSDLSDDTYVYATDGTFKKINEVYPDSYYYAIYAQDQIGGTLAGRSLTFSGTVAAPYVFFYDVDLNKVPDDDVTEKEEGTYDTDAQNKYNVTLHWSTAFDKFASNAVQANTQYDTMQEQYIIERSYDNSTWEIVSDEDVIIKGNNVASAEGKTIIDTGLKPFDKTTEQFGYTVWYRVTSIVEKSEDGTEMSTTTSNVVRVEIPGTVPFKLTLEGKGTSVYDPKEETNTFTNSIISSDSKVVEAPEVKAGSTLSLYRVDANGEIIVDDESPLITVTAEGGETLADLAKKIDNQNGENPAGEYTDECTLPAGDGNEAAYQLVMTIPGEGENSTPTYVYSNILRISNAAIANASIAAHRSGTPDPNDGTCAEKETFHNEITFKASANQVGTGYYIYRDNVATPIMKLNYTEQGFRVDGDTENTPIKPDPTTGYITIIDIVDDANPIAEGESGEETIGADGKDTWKYAVAYYDNDGNGNTYGSIAKPAEYTGGHDELVLNVEADIKAANFSQPDNYDIYTVVTITWNRTKEYDDTKPSFYEIYLKKNGNDRTDITVPKFEKIPGEIGPEEGSYTFTETYTSKWQSDKEQKYDITTDDFANSLKGAYEVYVKMTTTEGKEKNSFIAIPEPTAGAIYTGIEGIEAQEIDVKVVNGVVEVNGVNGLIKVIDAKGAIVAEAEGNGAVTEIEGLETGVYVVTANNMKPTKILIK